MEFFRKAKTVRLISHKDKYLVAEDDLVTISQDHDTVDDKFSAKNAIWTVEFVPGRHDAVRLKSCFGTYLTASTQPFLPGATGKKVVQTTPYYGDHATEWEPVRDGMQVRLRSFCGYFLRPNGGLPPWRNSVTHDVPHRNKTWEKLLWDVEAVDERAVTTAPQVMNSSCLFGRSRSRSFSGSMSSNLQNVA